MAAKPVVAVLHANSKQGTSVVLSLLESDKLAVKAVVRSANSDSASQRSITNYVCTTGMAKH